jgi:hypothetical protein
MSLHVAKHLEKSEQARIRYPANSWSVRGQTVMRVGRGAGDSDALRPTMSSVVSIGASDCRLSALPSPTTSPTCQVLESCTRTVVPAPAARQIFTGKIGRYRQGRSWDGRPSVTMVHASVDAGGCASEGCASMNQRKTAAGPLRLGTPAQQISPLSRLAHLLSASHSTALEHSTAASMQLSWISLGLAVAVAHTPESVAHSSTGFSGRKEAGRRPAKH